MNHFLENSFVKKHGLMLLLFTLDFCIKLFYMFSTDNIFFGDASARTQIIQFQSLHLSLLPHPDWLPFPFWISGLASRITGEIFWAPRVISTLFASLTIIPLFILSKKVFNLYSAILASLMFSFSIQILVIDTLTLSEPFFHFFSVSLFCMFFKNKYHFNDNILIGLLTMAICLTRLEGWVLCGILFLASLYDRNKVQALIIFFCAGISVIYWEALSYLSGRPFLQALFFSDYEVINIYKTNGWTDMDILWRASIGFTMLTLPVVLIGYFFCKKNKVRLQYFILISLFLFPAVYKLLTKSLFAEFRYFTIYAILLFPITGFIVSKYLMNKTLRTKVVFTTLFLFLATAVDYNWVYSRFQFPFHMHLAKGFKESALFFKKNLDISEHTIYIDFDRSWSRDLWITYANIAIRRHKGLCRVESHNWLGEYFSQASVDKCFSKNNKFYLFLLPNGLLNKYISQNLDMLKSKYNIKTIKDFNNHKIIELYNKEN